MLRPTSPALKTAPGRLRGVHLRGAGPIRPIGPDSKKSTEMKGRYQASLESIRSPVRSRWPIKRWKIVRGDTVEVISGVDTGKRGRVIEVVRPSNSIVVEGVNYTDWEKGMRRRLDFVTEAPIHVSNVMIVCPQTLQKTKVGFAFLEDGTKVRIAKKSGAIIPRPDVLTKRRTAISASDGPKDTPAEVVKRVTFKDEANLYEKYSGFAKVIEKCGIV